MITLLIFPLLWILVAGGRTLASWLGLPDSASPLERKLVALGLGLGLLAYGIMLLGLLGLLYPLYVGLWVLALAALGWGQHVQMARELAAWRPQRLRPIHWLFAAGFAAFGAVALVGVYSPPVVFIPGINDTEWDSISYHLADPAIFVQMHSLVSLPWQPQGHFAFTAEMWYTLALLLHAGTAGAKWFSWVCAAGTVSATYAIASRHLSARTGWVAALLVASTPLVFWEAGTAYVDGATAFFASLAVMCMANGMAEKNQRWVWAAAVLAGLALSTKAGALSIIFALAIGVLIWSARGLRLSFGQSLSKACAWGVAALAVGAPWYIRSWVETGNPIYPYFYAMLGGKWWDSRWASIYAVANSAGLGHGVSAVLVLPWNLTMAIVPGHFQGVLHPFNEFPSPLLALPPVFLAALLVPVLFRGGTPRVIYALAAYGALTTLLWFTQTQYIRFLLPLVPVYAILTAWALCRAWEVRLFSSYALAGLAALGILWSLSIGSQLSGVESSVAFGSVSKELYVARYDPGAGAITYINSQFPSSGKTALFGYPLGFYCHKPYLWADQDGYVFTPQVNSPGSLLARLQQLHVTDILVDTRSFGFKPGAARGSWLYALTAAREAPLYPGPSDPNHGVYVFALPRDSTSIGGNI